MSTTQFISPFASFLPSKQQSKFTNALGIDEEQACLERAKEESGANNNESISVLENRQSPSNMYSTQTSQAQHQDSTNNGQARRTRSSRLSHLPRLNSARGKQAFSGGDGGRNGQTGGGIGGGSGDGSDDGDDRRDSNFSQISEDPPSDDETIAGQEDGETETDSDSDASLASDDDLSGMPGSLPPPNSHEHRMSRGMSASSRGRRPSGIAMPPAPTFAHLEPFASAGEQNHLEGIGKSHANIGPTDTELTEELIDGVTTPKIGKRVGYENDSLNSTIKERTPSASMGPIQNRENWTQFGDETPGWLPTPRASAPAGSSMQSPKPGLSIQTQLKNGPGASPTDTSYFNIQPAPANNVIRNRNDSSNPNIPPPSPSIITRSRAQSSASLRSLGRITPGISSRELPPMPPIIPLNLRSADRARSPNRKIISPTPVLATPSLLTSTDESSADSTSEAAKSALASQDKQTGSRATTPRPYNATPVIKSAKEPALPASSPSSPRNSELALHSSLGRRAGTALLGMNESGNGRPGLYKQESRSLIDLNSPSRNQIEPTLKPLHKPVSVRDIRSSQVDQLKQAEQQARTASPAPSVESTTAPTSATASSTNLRRRRSMYEVGAAPPPYTIIPGGGNGIEAKIIPREEEGKESLPSYHCSVHIEGYLPRKMEFSSPGVQAKDRSWKRQYFVLHGTCLRIYRTDLSGERAALKGEHGVMSGVHVHHDPMNEDGPSQPVGSTTSKVIATDGNTNVNSKEQQQHNSTAASTANGHTANRSPTASTINSKLSDGHSGNGALSRKVEALSGTISHSLHRGSLVKQYTLQGAESGLAADYLKRRHVVRVRAEGEQFLLQTRNDRHVVDWIEAFQAATNIAMDLERRPMPKFITLPRRRRRRNGQRTRDASGNDATNRTANGTEEPDAVTIPDGDLSAREMADIAEARRRSLMDSSVSTSQRSSVSGQSRAPPPPRPLGLPGDEQPNPSAAFERMLREEEEAMSRQDAGVV
ncbi:uncharacterized protein FA14DRAFT_67348 [Meira miltonrushii]|uniref:PH domain-containing protein n=1 Tax=Meira miltonrushii TaxID=1280837 RepID=A0A316V8P2_9BASI|nr:uncharacterized protein FA14DRAFT_67348 [Meira miltonrushii]PWN33969.1 hypothetical protein FA14DRAFT_67348 [Meira miltonrushii]